MGKKVVERFLGEDSSMFLLTARTCCGVGLVWGNVENSICMILTRFASISWSCSLWVLFHRVIERS